MAKGLRFLLYCFITALVVVFAMGNKEIISFSFFPLPFEISITKYFLLLAFLLMGIILGTIFSYGQMIKRKKENWELNRKIKKLEEKVKLLDNEKNRITNFNIVVCRSRDFC